MTLEVRQLVLRAVVDDAADEDGDAEVANGARRGAGDADCCDDKAQLKEEILAECRSWLMAHLQLQRER